MSVAASLRPAHENDTDSTSTTTMDSVVLELDVTLTAEQALAECHRHGLVYESPRARKVALGAATGI